MKLKLPEGQNAILAFLHDCDPAKWNDEAPPERGPNAVELDEHGCFQFDRTTQPWTRCRVSFENAQRVWGVHPGDDGLNGSQVWRLEGLDGKLLAWYDGMLGHWMGG